MITNQTKGYLLLLAMHAVELILGVVTHVLLRGNNVSDVGVPMYNNEERAFEIGCFVIFAVSVATNLWLRRDLLKEGRIAAMAVTLVLIF